MMVNPPGRETPGWLLPSVAWLAGGQILNEHVPFCVKKLGVFRDGETVRVTGEEAEMLWNRLEELSCFSIKLFTGLTGGRFGELSGEAIDSFLFSSVWSKLSITQDEGDKLTYILQSTRRIVAHRVCLPPAFCCFCRLK